jgi:hypothetical protein
MQTGSEAKTKHQSKGLCAEAMTQPGWVFYTDCHSGTAVMGVDRVETHVPYEALYVDYPS